MYLEKSQKRKGKGKCVQRDGGNCKKAVKKKLRYEREVLKMAVKQRIVIVDQWISTPSAP